MAYRRFELMDEKSRKYWEILCQKDSFTVRFGRIGAAGQSKVKKFVSPEAARKAADRLIAEKTKKGYQEVVRSAQPAKLSKTSSGGSRHILAENIYQAAKNLGAAIDQHRELPRSVKRCPDGIREFYAAIVWPRRQSFCAPDFEPVPLYQVTFEKLQAVPAELRSADAKKKDLFAIGTHGGSNWILLLDGNDRNPNDPAVYELDHENPAESLSRLSPRLSRFLKALQKE